MRETIGIQILSGGPARQRSLVPLEPPIRLGSHPKRARKKSPLERIQHSVFRPQWTATDRRLVRVFQHTRPQNELPGKRCPYAYGSFMEDNEVDNKKELNKPHRRPYAVFPRISAYWVVWIFKDKIEFPMAILGEYGRNHRRPEKFSALSLDTA